MRRFRKNTNVGRKRVMAAAVEPALKSEYTYERYDHLSPEDCLNSFEVEVDAEDSTYIADTIGEIADGQVDIYNQDLCESCWDVYASGAWEEAVSNGLMGDEGDLMKALQVAQYEFYSGILYQNLDALVQNIMLRGVTDKGIEIDRYTWEDCCDAVITNVVNNDTFDEVFQKVLEYLNYEE